jgi:hypothetical protein
MNNHLFDQQNLTVEAFVAKSEDFTHGVKSIKYLVAEKSESYDGFFETIQGRLRDIKSSDNPTSVMVNLPDCRLILKSANVLGEYYSEFQHIKYYEQSPETLEIVKIHERFHAIHHLMPDKQGNIWGNFAKVDSFYKELLAQLFTYIYIQNYEPSLLCDFKDLNRNQPVIYQTFKIFSNYDLQQAIDLYWTIRNKANTNAVFKVLKQIVIWMKPTTSKIIVPTTALRHYYKSLSKLSASTQTQQNKLEDQLRGKNSDKLIQMYIESYEHIQRIYNNPNEPILDINNQVRKKSSGALGAISIKSDEDVISVLANSNPTIKVSNATYDFEYIEREVSPLRTTNALQDNGKSARRSGTGGIDFIGWNLNNNIPILGEIKVESDQNSFYALIQLLTYLSELSTPNQIDRINKYSLFNSHFLSVSSKFYLYILSCRIRKPGGKKNMILPETKTLANKLIGSIPQIENIVFLHMDPITKVITEE